MGEQTPEQLLSAIAQGTLEEMFFAMPDEVSSDRRRPEGRLVAASLTFKGSRPGWFGLLVSDPLARVLATDFLGFENAASLGSEHVTGVVAELANMICGAFLSELTSYSSFDLDSPTAVLLAEHEDGPDFPQQDALFCRLGFPAGSLLLFLAMEKSA